MPDEHEHGDEAEERQELLERALWPISVFVSAAPALLHLGQARILPAHDGEHAVRHVTPPNASRRQQSCVRVCERVRLLAVLAASALRAPVTEHQSNRGALNSVRCGDAHKSGGRRRRLLEGTPLEG